MWLYRWKTLYKHRRGNGAGLQELWYSSTHKNNLDLRDLKSSEWSNIVRPGQNYLWHFLLAIWKTNGLIWTGKGKVNGVKDASHFWDNSKTYYYVRNSSWQGTYSNFSVNFSNSRILLSYYTWQNILLIKYVSFVMCCSCALIASAMGNTSFINVAWRLASKGEFPNFIFYLVRNYEFEPLKKLFR